MNRTKLLDFELTYEERSTWGICTVCDAKHGEPCNPNFGLAIGTTLGGGRPEDGVHLGRLNRAPFRVRIVPA